jgi:hypothetical protein
MLYEMPARSNASWGPARSRCAPLPDIRLHDASRNANPDAGPEASTLTE